MWPAASILSSKLWCKCCAWLSVQPHTGVGAGRQKTVSNRDHEKSEVKLHPEPASSPGASGCTLAQSLQGIKLGEIASAQIKEKQVSVSWSRDSPEIRGGSDMDRNQHFFTAKAIRPGPEF